MTSEIISDMISEMTLEMILEIISELISEVILPNKWSNGVQAKAFIISFMHIGFQGKFNVFCFVSACLCYYFLIV